MATFKDLPNELLIQILSFVPLYHIRKFAFVNSKLYVLAKPLLEEDRRLYLKYAGTNTADPLSHGRKLLQDVMDDPKIAPYPTYIKIYFSRWMVAETVPEADDQLFCRVWMDSPWIADDEVPGWHRILKSGHPADTIFSLLLLVLPNLWTVELELMGTVTSRLSSIFKRVALMPSLTIGEARPLGNLSEIIISEGPLSDVLSLLALPSLRSMQISKEIRGKAPYWSADLPLSNLTTLSVGDGLSAKNLALILSRIKALKSFSCPYRLRYSPPEWCGLDGLLRKYSKHSLECLHLIARKQDEAETSFTHLYQFSRLKKICISLHFLKVDQGVRLVHRLPDAIQELEFELTTDSLPDEVAPTVMAMFEKMIEDKAKKGKIPNLQRLSIQLSGSTEVLNLNEERLCAFECHCVAAGVSVDCRGFGVEQA